MEKNDGYFHRVLAQMQTRFWINTAMQKELEYFLEEGAIGNTRNPTHASRAIKGNRELWLPVIDNILKENPDITDDQVADQILQKMVARTQKLFLPLYVQSKGKYGYVAIQGNPFTNNDLSEEVERTQAYSELGENVAVKIQSTKVGIKAVEQATALGKHTICTKGFSVAQATEMAEAYERGLERTDAKPKCFVVNIAGILDEYLTEQVEAEEIDIPLEYIRHAGVTITRKIYRIFKKRGYKAEILGGGSRAPHHFSELVGGDLGITISHSQAKPLIMKNPPVVSRIDTETPTNILKELERIRDFRRAYYVDGLVPHEFITFGPCVKFQRSCEKGYQETLREINLRRQALGIYNETYKWQHPSG